MAAPDTPADDPDTPAGAAPEEGVGVTGETLPSDDIEALLAAAAAGSVQMPPEDDEGTDPDLPDDGGAGHGAAEGYGDDYGDADDEYAGADVEDAWADLAPRPAGGDRGGDARPHGHGGPATSIPVGGQVEKLLEEVEAEVRRGRRPVLAAGQDPPDALGRTSPLELETFAENGPVAAADFPGGGLGSLDDVELDLRIELGRAEMSLEEVVALRDGSVVTLDKLAGDPVDILVNGRLVARGEVLVLNDNFCVRVAEILPPDR